MRRHLALLAVVVAPVGAHASVTTPPTGTPVADVVAPFRGGAAARLLVDDRTAVPGEVFELMGLPGLDRPARVWDTTPFPDSRPQEHLDSQQSNDDARSLVTAVVGERLDRHELTTPSGGGSSVGLAYALGYLNLWSDGAFSAETRVAATGRLAEFGWVYPVTALDEKLAAAVAAEVDVVFTPTWPSASAVAEHRVRRLGTLGSARVPGAVIAESRAWDEYRRWGSERLVGRVDLVGVRHVGDAVAYLCGAGSRAACELLDAVAELAASDPAVRDGTVVRRASASSPSPVRTAA